MKFSLDGKRYDTDRMIDCDISTRERHGTWIRGVYLTRKTHRVFVETDSIWDRGDGCCVGPQWHEADAYEISDLAERHECAVLRELLPDDSD